MYILNNKKIPEDTGMKARVKRKHYLKGVLFPVEAPRFSPESFYLGVFKLSFVL